jgi:two-component sensor histidine kinase
VFCSEQERTGAVGVANVVSGQKNRNTPREGPEALQRCERLHHLAQIIASDLDLERIVQTVTDIATEECGAQYGAFFWNVESENGEVYQLFTLSGAPREAFEHFGLPRNTAIFAPTFRGEGIVRAADIRADPRFGKNLPHSGLPQGHPPVVSYLAVPVVSRSKKVLGGLFFAHAEGGKFDAQCEDFVCVIAAHAAVAIDNAHLHRHAQIELEQRRRAEAQLELLLSEVKHRYRNAVVTIQSIATQTFHEAGAESHEHFAARLRALGKALDLLTTRDWDRVAVADVVMRALAPFDSGQRFSLSGVEASLSSDTSLVLALALHELATNAVKYGALSNDAGRVRISWEHADFERSRLRICWQEVDGPPVAPPSKTGFGSMLIQRVLGGSQGSAAVQYAPEGVICTFEAPV